MDIAIVSCANIDEAHLRSSVRACAPRFDLRVASGDEDCDRSLPISRFERGWIVRDAWDDDTLALAVAQELGAPALVLVLDEDDARAAVVRGAQIVDRLSFGDAPDERAWRHCFEATFDDRIDFDDPAEWLDALATSIGAPAPFDGASRTVSAQLTSLMDTIGSFMSHMQSVIAEGGTDLIAPARDGEDMASIDLCFTDELLASAIASGPPDFAWSVETTLVGDDSERSDAELDAAYARGDALSGMTDRFQRSLRDAGRGPELTVNILASSMHALNEGASPVLSSGPMRFTSRNAWISASVKSIGGPVNGLVIELDGPALREERLRITQLDTGGRFEWIDVEQGELPVRIELPELELDAGILDGMRLGPRAYEREPAAELQLAIRFDALREGTTEIRMTVAPLAGGPKRVCRHRVDVRRSTPA
jgi:hypothetical protein